MTDLPRSASLLVHDLAVRLRAIALSGYPGAAAAARASAEDDARQILLRVRDRAAELGLPSAPAQDPPDDAWDLTPAAASWAGIGAGALLAIVAALSAAHGDAAGVLATAIPGALLAILAPAFARAAASVEGA